MILGYDFIEERLFAARDYAGLSEEDAKLLRNYRNTYARYINDLKKEDREGAEKIINLFKTPEYQEEQAKIYEESMKKSSRKKTKHPEFYSELFNESNAMKKGAKIQQAKIIELRKLEKLPFYKTKGGKLAIAGVGTAGLAGLGYYGYKKYKDKKKGEEEGEIVMSK